LETSLTLMFRKEVSYAHQVWIYFDHKYRETSNIVTYCYNLK